MQPSPPFLGESLQAGSWAVFEPLDEDIEGIKAEASAPPAQPEQPGGGGPPKGEDVQVSSEANKRRSKEDKKANHVRKRRLLPSPVSGGALKMLEKVLALRAEQQAESRRHALRRTWVRGGRNVGQEAKNIMPCGLRHSAQPNDALHGSSISLLLAEHGALLTVQTFHSGHYMTTSLLACMPTQATIRQSPQLVLVPLTIFLLLLGLGLFGVLLSARNFAEDRRVILTQAACIGSAGMPSLLAYLLCNRNRGLR